MIIEVGKFYETRDGKKAIVVTDHGSGIYPFVVMEFGKYSTRMHTKSGHEFGEPAKSGNDLVKPFVDTERHDTVTVYTKNVRPPIPLRTHDWSAQVSLDGCATIGWGETQDEAIFNLFKAINEDIL